MKTYIVDAFTQEPFKGNPAGVCLVKKPLSDALMLKIAQELGLSETAFVQKAEVPGHFSIRYFSPKMEIPLCGHATLASARVIFSRKDFQELHFHTIGGLNLSARHDGEGIVMEFPVYDTVPAEAPSAMLAALGLPSILRAAYNRETNILLLEIASDEVLRGLNPDFEALLRTHDSINGVLVTATSSSPAHDFCSRYFWPWSGTNEDPVTGGTHTFLAKYWGERLGKAHMRSLQVSARTGSMEVELLGNGKMHIRSQAVMVLEGKLHV